MRFLPIVLLFVAPMPVDKVVSHTFTVSNYVVKTGCTSNRTIYDGVTDFAGTSGVRNTRVESSEPSIITLTAGECDPYEGAGLLPLQIDLYGKVTYHYPPLEFGMEFAQFWRVAAGYTLTVTYRPITGLDVTHTFYAPTEVFPSTWIVNLPQHAGELSGVYFSLIINADLTNGCENASSNGGCYPTYQLVTGQYQMVVTRQ